MEIQLLYVTGCPNLDLARQRLALAAHRAGVEPVISEREVNDEAEAVQLGMRGSPTILVGGQDVTGGAETNGSISCRLYVGDSGVGGAPSVEELVAALTG